MRTCLCIESSGAEGQGQQGPAAQGPRCRLCKGSKTPWRVLCEHSRHTHTQLHAARASASTSAGALCPLLWCAAFQGTPPRPPVPRSAGRSIPLRGTPRKQPASHSRSPPPSPLICASAAAGPWLLRCVQVVDTFASWRQKVADQYYGGSIERLEAESADGGVKLLLLGLMDQENARPGVGG